MRAFIERHGVDELRADKEILRRVVETQILEEPVFGLAIVGGCKVVSERAERHVLARRQRPNTVAQ